LRFPISDVQRASNHKHMHWPWVVALALLAGGVTPLVVPAPGAQAGSCGTNWKSKKQPPPSIRVLDTRTDKVQVVDFRDYVSLVMASGEFPTYDPKPVLEAGATAVKQYGWYYTLAGHHRSSYHTAAGVCYDVRDDTNDQLFRPEYATPTQKQLDAVAHTWGLTLRKNGRFFLTGYRYGDDVACATDADGWKLYERSMIDCAKKGWDRQKIQSRYYQPRVTFVWNASQPSGSGDKTAPSVTRPHTALRDGVKLGRVVMTVRWGATDKGTGVAGYTLQHRVRTHNWRNVTLSSKTATEATFYVRSDRLHQFRVRATDGAGNVSDFATGARIRPQVLQTRAAVLTGTWKTSSDPAASGGATRFATQPAASATLSFRGFAVGVVGQLGPGRGQARVLIDGKGVATIDLGAASLRQRRVVFSQRWNVRALHTIALKVLGTQGRPRFDLDAFVVLR
jgi:hypothetical protein